MTKGQRKERRRKQTLNRKKRKKEERRREWELKFAPKKKDKNNHNHKWPAYKKPKEFVLNPIDPDDAKFTKGVTTHHPYSPKIARGVPFLAPNGHIKD